MLFWLIAAPLLVYLALVFVGVVSYYLKLPPEQRQSLGPLRHHLLGSRVRSLGLLLLGGLTQG